MVTRSGCDTVAAFRQGKTLDHGRFTRLQAFATDQRSTCSDKLLSTRSPTRTEAMRANPIVGAPAAAQQTFSPCKLLSTLIGIKELRERHWSSQYQVRAARIFVSADSQRKAMKNDTHQRRESDAQNTPSFLFYYYYDESRLLVAAVARSGHVPSDSTGQFVALRSWTGTKTSLTLALTCESSAYEKDEHPQR